MSLYTIEWIAHVTPAVIQVDVEEARKEVRPVGADDQGKALGLIANSESLLAIVAPLVWGYLYRATVGWNAGLAYFVMGSTAGVAFLLSLGLRAPSPVPGPVDSM